LWLESTLIDRKALNDAEGSTSLVGVKEDGKRMVWRMASQVRKVLLVNQGGINVATQVGWHLCVNLLHNQNAALPF
jgi:hypothetical protein